MEYSCTKEREFNEIIREARESGKYKIADLSLFDTINNLEVSEDILLHLEYTTEILIDYLHDIEELGEEEPGLKEYLMALKSGDILDNQQLEKENSFLIGMYMQVKKESAIDKMIRYIKEKKEISVEDIYDIHRTLIYGTSSKGIETIRTKNDTFVGKIVNGQKTYDYFPIDYKEAEIALDKIVNLYNQRLTGNNYNNLFLQAFIIHGLLGAFQIFGDANTRLGRIMQHTLIWQLINERTEFNFDLPPIYATRNYYPYRSEYRGLISKIVKDNNREAWNDWFEFNLKRIEDQIYKNNENLHELRRRQGKTKTYRRY